MMQGTPTICKDRTDLSIVQLLLAAPLAFMAPLDSSARHS